MMKILDNFLAIVAQKMCRLYSSGGIEMEDKKKINEKKNIIYINKKPYSGRYSGDVLDL